MTSLYSKWLMTGLMLFGGINPGNTSSERMPHPFYVSVTEVEQNTKDKTLEISCKFFTDDFEHTIEKAFNTRLDIVTGKDKTSFDKYIPNYIGQHLTLSPDGKAAKLKYVGYEVEKESVYCYFEISNAAPLNQLEIVNSLLHDFTKDQINIIHVTVNGKRQSSRLNYPTTKANFVFKQE